MNLGQPLPSLPSHVYLAVQPRAGNAVYGVNYATSCVTGSAAANQGVLCLKRVCERERPSTNQRSVPESVYTEAHG